MTIDSKVTGTLRIPLHEFSAFVSMFSHQLHSNKNNVNEVKLKMRMDICYLSSLLVPITLVLVIFTLQ